MNNTLTAKEWLEKETFADDHFIESRNPFNEDMDVSEAMEKYANYKNRILEDRIKEFRAILLKRVGEKAIEGYNFAKERDLCAESNTIYQSYINVAAEDLMIEEYDKHFNIENKQ